MPFLNWIKIIGILCFLLRSGVLWTQELPKILSHKSVIEQNYLPDFSYAGYHFGEKKLPHAVENIVLAEKHGIIPNDGLDDSKALLLLMDSLNEIAGKVILQLPKGRIILSSILYIKRSHFILRGYGTSDQGTEIYCPRPLMYVPPPPPLAELREYLQVEKKRQRERKNNIDLPYSPFSWAGGFIWTHIPDERIKPYLEKYDRKEVALAKVLEGEIGEHTIKIDDARNVQLGDVLELQVFNAEGKDGLLIKELYRNASVKVGEAHWKFPNRPIVRQQIKVVAINNNTITVKAPLSISIKPNYQAQLTRWKHLKEVGLEHFKITFPTAPYIAHHIEMGFNGIFLTRLFNSWVNDVIIENADSGVLTEEIANVTISNIITKGANKAHYSVALGSVHNVLVKNLKIYNNVLHPLSFNTLSTKSVYQQCEVFKNPILDQHSGANHQNLFDNISVYISPKNNHSYALFKGGGASYWKPTAGPYNTFWNIKIHLSHLSEFNQPLLLYGMKDGTHARIIGVNGDLPLKIEYGPDPYIEKINESMKEVPSLYDYQLTNRLN